MYTCILHHSIFQSFRHDIMYRFHKSFTSSLEFRVLRDEIYIVSTMYISPFSMEKLILQFENG